MEIKNRLIFRRSRSTRSRQPRPRLGLAPGKVSYVKACEIEQKEKEVVMATKDEVAMAIQQQLDLENAMWMAHCKRMEKVK